MNLPTWVHKNGHNPASDQYFFLQTCTIVRSIHRAIYAKNSTLMKNSQQSLILEQVTFGWFVINPGQFCDVIIYANDLNSLAMHIQLPTQSLATIFTLYDSQSQL